MFCQNNMVIPHNITTNTTTTQQISHRVSQSSSMVEQRLNGMPLSDILREFFRELKGTFISKQERINIFDDL